MKTRPKKEGSGSPTALANRLFLDALREIHAHWDCVENDKRRRALDPLDGLIFIPKAKAGTR